MSSRAGRDDGSYTLEAVILQLVVLLTLALVVALARVALARGTIDSVARNAARAASLARTTDAARAAASAAARAAVTAQHLDCTGLHVTVDTTGFAAPIGHPAVVRVTVTCHANLADLALPGVPGSKTLSSTFVSPLDPYRSRAVQSTMTQNGGP